MLCQDLAISAVAWPALSRLSRLEFHCVSGTLWPILFFSCHSPLARPEGNRRVTRHCLIQSQQGWINFLRIFLKTKD